MTPYIHIHNHRRGCCTIILIVHPLKNPSISCLSYLSYLNDKKVSYLGVTLKFAQGNFTHTSITVLFLVFLKNFVAPTFLRKYIYVLVQITELKANC